MIEIPGHLYIAIGAVTASIIAGVFSYFNLVTSKETKISEFRQDWINELRKDISKYVSSMQSLMTFESYIKDHLEDEMTNLEILKRRAELHDATLASYNFIQLRINKNENDAKAKKINNSFILSLEKAHENRKTGGAEGLDSLLEQVITNAEALLKHEWNRVRDGEKSYRWSKHGALLLLAISITTFILVGFFIGSYDSKEALIDSSQSPTSTNIKSNKNN